MRIDLKRISLSVMSTLITLVVLRTITVGADSIQWKNLGPGSGGNLRAVGVSPADPNIALMGSDVGGIYRTADGGQTWSLRNNALVTPSRFIQYGFYSHFEFDPANPNVVYFSYLKSADAGLTWHINVDESRLDVGGAKVDPSNPSTVYAFGYGQVFRSTDAWAGTSCLGISRPLEGDGSCSTGFSCTTCGTPAATCQPGVSKCYQQSCLPHAGSGLTSQDNCGENFDDSIRALAINPSNPNELIACADSGLYRSTNGARNWFQFTPELAAGSPEPLPPGICYGGTTPGASCNANADCPGPDPNAISCRSVECVNLIHHTQSNTLFMVVNTHPLWGAAPAYSGQWLDVDSWRGGVYKSLDWGQSWTSLNGTEDTINWLPNPSFNTPGSPVSGWVADTSNPGSVTQDCTVRYDPNGVDPTGCSVKFQYSDSGPEYFHLQAQSLIPVTGGQLYELTAAHKFDSATGYPAYAKVWYYRSDMTPINWAGLPYNSVEPWTPRYDTPTTVDWRRFKARLRPPDAAAFAQLIFSVGGNPTGSGTAWVDEVLLHKVYDLPRLSGQASNPYLVTFSDIAVDPFDANTIYAGTLRESVLDIAFTADTSGVWKTTDGGAHWNLTTRRQWHDNVQDNGAAVCGDNVCGGRWENCNSCPNDCTGPSKPAPPACCGNNIIESGETYNNCQADVAFDPDPAPRPYYEVDSFYDPDVHYNPDPDINYYYAHAGGNPSYYIWSMGIGRNEPPGSTLLGRNTLYAGAPEHLKTTDAGATWQDTSSTLYTGSDSQAGTLQARGDSTDVFAGPVATRYDPSTLKTRLYYGDTDNFLQVSYNEGKSFAFEGWQWYPQSFGPGTTSPGVIGDAASSIVLDPNNVNRIYVGVSRQIGNLAGQFVTSGGMNGGTVQGDYAPAVPPAVGRWQWTPLGNNDPNTANAFPLGSGGVDLLRTSGGSFLASIYGRGVYRLSGSDWLPAVSYGANAPLDLLTYRLYQEPTDLRLYVGAGDMSRTSPALSGETGIWESSDLGVNWCRVSNHADAPQAEDNMDKEPVVDLITMGPNNLLAATVFSHGADANGNPTGGGIYRGTRTGSCAWSWDRVFSQYTVTGLARSPLDNSLLYAYVGQFCCSGSLPGQQAGIYKSIDGGMSWSPMANNGLMNLAHARLTYSSANPQRLYASTIGSGLFEGTIACADPARDFECATRVPFSNQQVISGSLLSGTQGNLLAASQDDTYEVFQESAAPKLRVLWTFPGALASVPYSVRFEGSRTSSAGDIFGLSFATRASGNCTGSEAYSSNIVTVTKTADDDLIQTGNLGILPGSATVFCVQLMDSAIGDGFVDQVTVDRLYLLPHPGDVLASADDTNGPGIIFSGSYADTWTSNNVWEVLREEVSGNTSLLVHTWRFDNVPAGTSHALHLEGNRPNNADGDNFQFYYSTDGTNFSIISGALINKGLEQPGGGDYSIAVGTGGTWYIRVLDTNAGAGKTGLDTVKVDHLSLKTVP